MNEDQKKAKDREAVEVGRERVRQGQRIQVQRKERQPRQRPELPPELADLPEHEKQFVLDFLAEDD